MRIKSVKMFTDLTCHDCKGRIGPANCKGNYRAKIPRCGECYLKHKKNERIRRGLL
jgi:hypothetical protein